MQWQTSLEAINCCVHNLVWIMWLTWLVVLQNPLASIFSLVIELSLLNYSLVLATQVGGLSNGYRTRKSVSIPLPKMGNAKECSNYHRIPLNLHTSNVMLKILQVRLQQYLNPELPDVQGGFRKGRGTREQIANICWIMEKAREFQKNIYFSFIDYAKRFDCVDHNRLWEIFKEMRIPDHLTCLLRNLYAGQEATVRTRHGTMDWFKIDKGVRQGCILSSCLFNLHTEYIMWNAKLNELPSGIKTARRNINNLR